jgi:hypothetical protein
MWKRLRVKHRLFLPDFNETQTFPMDFKKKKAKILNLIKIRPVGRTDMTKLIVAFCYFANAPEN